MTQRESFDEIADAAIEMTLRGVPAARVLELHPRYAEALQPLLSAAEAVRSSPAAPAPSERLADNFAGVRAALRRARPQQPQVAPRGWWQRRLSFASMSLPAGLAAGLLLVGVAAAAAGTVSQTSGLPSGITHAITFGQNGGSDAPSAPARSSGTPEVRSGADGEASRTIAAGARSALTATPSGTVVMQAEETAAAGAASPGAGGAAPGVAPTSTPGATTTASGTIHGVHGNSFTLTGADGEWKVNIDAKTVVNGTIAEGATATVTGDVTAGKNLHAATVDVVEPEGPQTPTVTITPSAGNGHTPGPPPDHTPPGQAKTPGSNGNGH
jgi:hypothetical protein